MASLQQVIEQLALLVAAGTNETSGANVTSTMSAPQGPLDLMTTMYKMLSASGLRDWAILLIIGSLFETARRWLSALWYWLIDSCFITAVFEDQDASFQWIMLWLSKQPSWKGARNVQISTSNFDLDTAQIDANVDPDPNSRKVIYLPATSQSYTLWYNYRWMRITRSVETKGGGWSPPTRETLNMSIMTRDRGTLARIIQEAKNEYVQASRDKIAIFVSDRFHFPNGWRELATRPKRPLNSIILDPGITDLVLGDVQDFLNSKEWYAERGIPFRRGYLLYGVPGSGKTSLIHSIAGELGLDVYIISLSRPGMCDIGLAELISALPERCIALLEDIDAAFHHGLSRESPDADSTGKSDGSDQPSRMPPGPPFPFPTGSRVSLSGLLNALDGIGAQEGRVLFATTNKYSSLDPALCRPGRMDMHIEFKQASRFQAEELFKRFFAPSSSSASQESKHERQNGHANVPGKDAPPKDLIDLSDPNVPPGSSRSDKLSEKTEEGDPPRPTYGGFSHSSRAPSLSLERVNQLAAEFALAVPERQLSMASLQGFLMMHKTRPFAAVSDVGAWVEKELADRKPVVKVVGTGIGATGGLR